MSRLCSWGRCLARRQRISQPAISQQVSALETLFDTRLLSRGRNRVRMTQSGELLYKHAVAVLNKLESLKSGRENLTDNIAGLSVLHMATTQYLNEKGRPTPPDALIKLDYIQYKISDNQITTPLLKDGEIIQAPIKIGLTAQLPDLVFQALHANLGYAKVPEFLLGDALQKAFLRSCCRIGRFPKKNYLLYIRRVNRCRCGLWHF